MKSKKKLKTILCSVFLCLIALLAVPGPKSSAAAAKKVALNKTQLAIKKGKTGKLTLKNVKKGVKVKWSSSKKSVATVKANGASCVVTAKKAGTAVITAKAGKKSYKCTVTVKKASSSSSQKKKALKAYEQFLKSGYISTDSIDYIPKRSCKFSLIYLDSDSVPELVLHFEGMEFDNPWQNGVLYTYSNGKVKKLGDLNMMNRLSYYKKKGVLADYTHGDETGDDTVSYSRLNKGKYQRYLSYSAIKKYVGRTKQTRATFYKNTESNRQKYLK